jgi:hypothetical protein
MTSPTVLPSPPVQGTSATDMGVHVDPTLVHKHGYNLAIMAGRGVVAAAGLILTGLLTAAALAELTDTFWLVGFIVGVFLGGLAAAAMFSVGRGQASTTTPAATPRHLPSHQQGLVVCWVGAGVALALATATEASGAMSALALAAVTLAAHTVAGMSAYTEGRAHNPVWASLIQVRDDAAHAVTETSQWDGILTRSYTELHRANADLAHATQWAAIETTRIHATHAWALARARQLIAEKVGTLGATGITSPHHPNHPDRDQTSDPGT